MRPKIVLELVLVCSFLGMSPGLSGESAASPARSLPTRRELATYRITYGVLGQVGDVTIAISPLVPRIRDSGSPGDDRSIRVSGLGRGSFLGLGETERRIQSDFDPLSLGVKRWVSVRTQNGKSVADLVEQEKPGALALVRRRAGRPDQAEALARPAQVLDPLGFLLRLRLDLPTRQAHFEVLDGRGLWLITLAPPQREAGARPSLRVAGKAEPIFWDGVADPERTTRTFTLWFSDDAYRMPLRMSVPIGIGAVQADLVAVTRRERRAGLFRTLSLEPVWRWLSSLLARPPLIR